jgi:hypothetical protein
MANVFAITSILVTNRDSSSLSERISKAVFITVFSALEQILPLCIREGNASAVMTNTKRGAHEVGDFYGLKLLSFE